MSFIEPAQSKISFTYLVRSKKRCISLILCRLPQVKGRYLQKSLSDPSDGQMYRLIWGPSFISETQWLIRLPADQNGGPQLR